MVFEMFPHCLCSDDCYCDVSLDPTNHSTTGSIKGDKLKAEMELLFHAVKYDQHDVLKHLIKHGANPNTCDSNKKPLLNVAIEKGNYECIQTLLKNGCNVNLFDRNGQTALMCAVCMDDLAIVKLAVKLGADINEVDNTGKSALLLALRDSRFDIARYLIKKGADVNIVDRLGQSALFFLANNEHCDSDKLLRKLLNAGYITAKDKSWLGDEMLSLTEDKPKGFILQKFAGKIIIRIHTFKISGLHDVPQ